MTSTDAEKYKEQGNKQFQSKNYDEAISLYSNAINLSPTAIYYSNRAAAYVAKDLPDKAIDDCNRAIEKDPTYVKSYFRRGQAYLSKGKLKEAELDFQRVLKDEPKNTNAKDAQNEVNKVRILMDKAAKCIQDELFSEALAHYREVMRICTQSTEANLGIADACIGLKNYHDAKTIATAILKNDPENTHGLLVRGLSLYFTGELAASSKFFGNILQLDPDNKKAQKYWKLSRQIENLKEEGNKEFREKNFANAIKLWSDALNADPSCAAINKLLLANRGAALKSLGKYEEAIADLTASLEIDNEYLKAYVRRAQCYMELKKYEEAERDYNMASLKDPGDKELKRSLNEAKKLRKIACRKDYYQILGVEKNFSDRDLTKAYKRRCLEFHPDRRPEEEREEAEKKFKEVQEAYDILKDPRKRQAYDSGADLEEINGGGGFSGGFHEGVDISDLFNMFGRGGPNVRTHFGGGFPF